MIGTTQNSTTVDRKEVTTGGSSKEYDCKKCGYKHKARQCPAFNKPCMNCGLNGHFKVGCKSGKFG